jgi:Rieske Fe-S protein
MFRHAFCATLILAGMIAGAASAHAENRLALVIGQSAYRTVTALPNPANDAKAMSQLLGDAGFEVTTAADLSQKDMNDKVGEFVAKIAAKGPDTVALVFYAGHGLQIDGENYLVPVDVDLKRETDIPLQAVRLNDVLNTLNSVPSKMRILMLDACRNDPFAAIKQTAGHGLALVNTKTGAPGTFLSYSTSPGAEAEDGDGADSPYTTALLAAAREPGLSIEEAFKRVRVSVNKATQGRQTPWDSSSLTESFAFVRSPAGADAAAPKPAVAQRSVEQWRQQLQGKPVEVANVMIVADGTDEAYEAFVALFTQPPYAPQARDWLDRHRRMVAWSDAVLLNTVAAYRGFLAQYPGSDLTATARKLIERLRYRPSPLPLVATAAVGGSNATGSSAGSTPQSGLATPSQPTTAALGPTCPCTTPLLPIKKVEAPPARKSREPDPPRRARSRPSRIPDGDEDVVVVRRSPPPGYYEPGPPVGIGIGIGLGGYGGGMGRGGPVGVPGRRGNY